MHSRLKLTGICVAAAFALAACGGGSSSTTMPEPEPTAYEVATAAIAAATTDAAVEAAVAAAMEGVTGTQLTQLRAAADVRKQALATMARAGDQKTALMAAAGAIDTSATMTTEEIAAANAAIAALRAAIAAAVDVDDTSMYQAQVTAAEANVMESQSALDHAAQTAELADAVTGFQAIDLSDLSTQEKIDAAEAAIAALRMALDAAADVSDADKAMYQSTLDDAGAAVRMAQTGLDTQGRMVVQRTAITNAVTMARTAVNGVTNMSTDSEMASAHQAIADLEAAIAGAADLPDGDTDVASARGTLATLKAQLMTAKTVRTTYLAAKADDDMKAAAATGKAVYAALAGPTTNANALANTNEFDVRFLADERQSAANLWITAGAGTTTTIANTPVRDIQRSDSVAVGSLGGWTGVNYAHETGTGDSRVTYEVRVYHNQETARRVLFADALTGGATVSTTGASKGYLTTLIATNARGAAFMHSGTRTHTIPDRADAFHTRGTYLGAPGEFRCTGTCTSTNDGERGPSAFGGIWCFKPDAGAMAIRYDDAFLAYGWWVSRDSEGRPTAASAFQDVIGRDLSRFSEGRSGAYSASPITGSATYASHAAGVYAIDNVLDGTGHGGHFTADARLEATFSGDAGGCWCGQAYAVCA